MEINQIDSTEDEETNNNLKGTTIQVEMVTANDPPINTSTASEQNQEAQIIKEIRNTLSCRQHVSPVGMLILFGYLSISAGHFIIFCVYANNNYSFDVTFQKINRPGVWIFLMFSIL